MDALRKDRRYTYADYAGWDMPDRYELIDGEPYMMSSPSRTHQVIVGELYGQLRGFLKGKPYKVYISPFDVRLNAAGDNDDTVVQPDILVVFDSSKIDESGCNGAPDMIIEVVSPSSGKLDRLIKLQKYQEAGVKEYWIVEPDSQTLLVYSLESGKRVSVTYFDADSVPVKILPGCLIDMREVFAE